MSVISSVPVNCLSCGQLNEVDKTYFGQFESCSCYACGAPIPLKAPVAQAPIGQPMGQQTTAQPTASKQKRKKIDLNSRSKKLLNNRRKKSTGVPVFAVVVLVILGVLFLLKDTLKSAIDEARKEEVKPVVTLKSAIDEARKEEVKPVVTKLEVAKEPVQKTVEDIDVTFAVDAPKDKVRKKEGEVISFKNAIKNTDIEDDRLKQALMEFRQYLNTQERISKNDLVVSFNYSTLDGKKNLSVEIGSDLALMKKDERELALGGMKRFFELRLMQNKVSGTVLFKAFYKKQLIFSEQGS